MNSRRHSLGWICIAWIVKCRGAAIDLTCGLEWKTHGKVTECLISYLRAWGCLPYAMSIAINLHGWTVRRYEGNMPVFVLIGSTVYALGRGPKIAFSTETLNNITFTARARDRMQIVVIILNWLIIYCHPVLLAWGNWICRSLCCCFQLAIAGWRLWKVLY